MRHFRLLGLALLLLGAGPAPPLPRGSEHFRLSMSRVQVDSAVAARELEVVSNGTAFLVCASGDPRVEYEQYAFFHAPHGLELLWKVTIGYRLDATAADFGAVREELMRQLGPPTRDSWAGSPQGVGTHAVVWTDALTTVQLGARWSENLDRGADRMMVTWTDRRLQKLVEARSRRAGSSASR